MTELPQKHRKVKPLSRVHMMDIAKLIRNLNISELSKNTVRNALSNYFSSIDPFFDKRKFNSIASGKLDFDFKTEVYSFVKKE